MTEEALAALETLVHLHPSYRELERENAALREFAQALARADRSVFEPLNLGECHFCFGKGQHQAVCPVARARRWLEMNPAREEVTR